MNLNDQWSLKVVISFTNSEKPENSNIFPHDKCEEFGIDWTNNWKWSNAWLAAWCTIGKILRTVQKAW